MDGYDDASDVTGRTLARPTAGSLSDMFRRPWEGRGSRKTIKTRPVYRNSVAGDPLLKELADIQARCAEEHNCETLGGNGTNAFRCPNSKRCLKFWMRAVNQASRGYSMPQDVFDRLKAEFEERIRPE